MVLVHSNKTKWVIKGKVKTMNAILDKLVVDVDRLGITHERISSLEMMVHKTLEERFVNIKERIGKLSENLKTMVNIINNSLKSTTKGLYVLNEKALKLSGKPLELGDIEKEMEDVNCSNLVEKNEDPAPSMEKDVDVGSCLRTRSKTKKWVAFSFEELKDVMEMHEENLASVNVLEKML